MTTFPDYYHENLEGRKVKDTAPIMKGERGYEVSVNTHAFNMWLGDLRILDGKSFGSDAGRILGTHMSNYFPEVPWSLLFNIHAQIMTGELEIKQTTVGGVIRLIRSILSFNAGVSKELRREVKDEAEMQRRAEYLATWPGNIDIVDRKMDLEEFLNNHPPEAFPNLIHFREFFIKHPGQ